jgi:hypothetical protein
MRLIGERATDTFQGAIKEKTMAKFPLGQIMMTRAINDRVADDTAFAKLVWNSLLRHANGDWGDLDKADVQANNEAVLNGERLLSAYGSSEKIWIITEWDRSVTTILFPGDY